MQHLPIDYTGRHVFVAGGTSGINLGVAEAFAAAGACVSVLSRDARKVELATSRLRSLGAQAAGASADVREPKNLADAVASVVGSNGPLDVVVSGAAGNFLCAAEHMSPNGFRTVVDIDLIGSFNVMNACFPHLSKPGASIIHVTAPQSSIPMRYQVHACAAKAGVDQMTRVLALEWGPAGVRVNAISPGPIQVAYSPKPGSPGYEYQVNSTMLGRVGQPREIAYAALYLAADESSFVTGTNLVVDGGWTAM